MKGTVAPPSSSVTVASTCSARTPSSCAIFWLMFATRESLYPSTHRGANHRLRDAAYGPTGVDSSRYRGRPSTGDFLLKRCDLATFVGVSARRLWLDRCRCSTAG